MAENIRYKIFKTRLVESESLEKVGFSILEHFSIVLIAMSIIAWCALLAAFKRTCCLRFRRTAGL